MDYLVVIARGLHPSDTGFEIELVGEIAQMAAFGSTTNTKKAAIPKDAACSARVVAGRGFEPLTFRL